MTDDELMRVYVHARNGEPLAGLRAVAARARAEALEEAARVCESVHMYYEDEPGRTFSAAIRARAAEGGL